MIRGLLYVVLAGSLLAGCPDNPYSYETWTKQLEDPHTSERAVQELEQLGNPGAIPALGKAWASQGKPVRLLQVIIGLARPMTKEEAAEKYFTDYEKTGREASWDKALPFLKQAIDELDEINPRSIDSAQKAAGALGEAGLAEGLDSLIALATKPTTKKIIAAQIDAIRAMGKMEAERGKAAGALEKLLDREPPQHPRTATKEEKASVSEKFGLFLGTTGAAINSLGELHSSSSAKPLILALYRTPELFTQTRRALVAIGPSAKEGLTEVLHNKYAPVTELFKAGRYDQYCGDSGKDKCTPVSAKDFYAAVVLGDFYDPKLAPVLLEALDQPPLPAHYQNGQPGPTQHNAVFDALRKIGSPEGADKVRELALAKTLKEGGPPPKAGAKPEGVPLVTRILAINAYPFLTRDTKGMEELGKIAATDGEDDDLRTEAATAFARLATDAAHVEKLLVLSKKYLNESNKKKAEQDVVAKGEKETPRAQAEKSDKELAATKKANDEAKAAALKATKDPSMSVAQIKAATARAKETDLAYEVAKDENAAKTTNFKRLEQMSKDYKSFARMFQTHAARIAVAIRCKQDLKCYADTLKLKPDDSAKNVQGLIKNEKDAVEDLSKWTKEEKLGLWEGEVERAMLELGKAGQAASAHMDALLDAAKTDDRLVRQSILLALPKIAKVPCSTCEAKLDAAIKAGEGKVTLGDLNVETTMLRNYFAWAGGKTPSKGAPPAAEAGGGEAKPEEKKDEAKPEEKK